MRQGPCQRRSNCHMLGLPRRGMMERGRTRSARESNSCPIRELFLRHLATFPSMKSKKSPNGMKVIAMYRFERSSGLPRQYRRDEKILIAPQKPVFLSGCLLALICSVPVSLVRSAGQTIELCDEISHMQCAVRIMSFCQASCNSSLI